jgi:hypothetical protein
MTGSRDEVHLVCFMNDSEAGRTGRDVDGDECCVVVRGAQMSRWPGDLDVGRGRKREQRIEKMDLQAADGSFVPKKE